MNARLLSASALSALALSSAALAQDASDEIIRTAPVEIDASQLPPTTAPAEPETAVADVPASSAASVENNWFGSMPEALRPSYSSAFNFAPQEDVRTAPRVGISWIVRPDHADMFGPVNENPSVTLRFDFPARPPRNDDPMPLNVFDQMERDYEERNEHPYIPRRGDYEDVEAGFGCSFTAVYRGCGFMVGGKVFEDAVSDAREDLGRVLGFRP